MVAIVVVVIVWCNVDSRMKCNVEAVNESLYIRTITQWTDLLSQDNIHVYAPAGEIGATNKLTRCAKLEFDVRDPYQMREVDT